MSPAKFYPSTDDGINLVRLDIKEAENDSSLKFAASTYDFENNMLRDGIFMKENGLLLMPIFLNMKFFLWPKYLKHSLKLAKKKWVTPLKLSLLLI